MQVNFFIFSGTRADFTANKTLEELLPNFQDEKTKSEIINQMIFIQRINENDEMHYYYVVPYTNPDEGDESPWVYGFESAVGSFKQQDSSLPSYNLLSPFHLFSLTKKERNDLYLFTRYFEQPYHILGDIDDFFEFYSKSFIYEVTKGDDYILLDPHPGIRGSKITDMVKLTFTEENSDNYVTYSLV